MNKLSHITLPEGGGVEQGLGYCTLCGGYGLFLSNDPLDFPCKRNSFICPTCGSLARNRHIAHTILSEFRHRANCASLAQFAPLLTGEIWIGCIKEAVSRILGLWPNVTRSEFIDGMRSGEIGPDGVMCQDIQETSFESDRFDLIITEDVLEHVPNPYRAFQEIRRILRPGGKHIFTIPIDWSVGESFRRASVEGGEIVHHHEPEIHGDPFRKDGVLAFYTFGTDVIERFCELTGPTRMIAAHGDQMMIKGFQIHNNWVFVSEK